MSKIIQLILILTTCTTQPTTTQPTCQIDKILTKLENAGKKIKTIQANIEHQLYQIIPDDRQTKIGYIRFQAGNDKHNPKFMVHFHTLIHDDLKLKRKEWFCFDGHWLREIREQTKTVIDREIIAPDEKINPFKLGEGPFPLPFGQNKKTILENFNVKIAKPNPKDPPNTTHLILHPKKGCEFYKKYKQIEFWIDKKINLPIKISALDRHSNLIMTKFSDIKINLELKPTDLWIKIPQGYAYQKEPLEKSH